MSFSSYWNSITQVSPNNKIAQQFFAFYLLIVFVLCITLNSLLILIFVRHKKIRTPLNNIILITTLFNLLGSVQFPLVIHSNLNHR